MDDLIVDFIAETEDSLQELDQDIVTLEQTPDDPDLIGKIFRVMHTIKGTCGFLGLPRLESIAHSGENILGKFRDKEIDINADGISLILESIDNIKDIVLYLSENGEEPAGDDSDLKNRIASYIENKGQSGGSSAPAAEAASPESEKTEEKQPSDQPATQEELDELDRIFHETEADDSAESNDTPAQDNAAPTPPPPAAQEKKPEPTKTEAKPEAAKAAAKPTGAKPAQSLRVNVDVLEELMTIASELVLTRNQILQIMRQDENKSFETALQRLNHNVSELQESVMKTRMQPIGNAWSKLPRIIRDLGQELDKKIDLVMEGEETELDRQVLELIKDPLTHMVRNSADHGIETPADRIKAGKSEKGTVNLSAFHEGGHIIIQIADDGKGLNTERIKQKAIEKGVMTKEELAEATDKQIHNLIFDAGFSTAEKVTSVSGRGVGMDVVRSNIEKIGGTVDLVSEEGKGSTFTIKIPLTLAIVSALIVKVGSERFAIPQINVMELVRSDQQENKIETINGSRVLRLRDHLLPLLDLKKILQLHDEPEIVQENEQTETPVSADETTNSDTDEELEKKLKEENAFILVVQLGNSAFGVIVDAVFDTEEIVVKPVSPILRNIEMFSGNTILGDGSVVMILDVNGISKSSGDISVFAEDMRLATEEEEQDQHDENKKQKEALLLFRAGGEETKAVPLQTVGRLEEFDTKDIETADGSYVVQYRDRLMPLISVDENHKLAEKFQPVIVFFDNVKNKTMGIMVDKIIDVIEETFSIEQSKGENGLLGSAIIQGKATDIIDVTHYISQASQGDWFDIKTTAAYDREKSFGQDYIKRKLLLVDDSSFFRGILEPFLKTAGFVVTTAEDPDKALALREKGLMFDIIVSDIEMPIMSGFDLAENIRKEGIWQNIPIVALSSHATQEDKDEGKRVGFNAYIPKFDREKLLNALKETLDGGSAQTEQRKAS